MEDLLLLRPKAIHSPGYGKSILTLGWGEEGHMKHRLPMMSVERYVQPSPTTTKFWANSGTNSM